MRYEEAYNYLIDIACYIKEDALKAKHRRDEARSNKDKDELTYVFDAGRLMAYHEIITMMQQHAEIFGIPLKDLRLHDITENDLI